MVEIDPVITVSRFVNFFNILSPFRFYLPLEKGVTLDLYKFESPCTQGCFVPSLVEITQWFGRRRGTCQDEKSLPQQRRRQLWITDKL